VRPAALIVCALLLELGWLVMWPMSFTLSHSALFTSSLLISHPSIQHVLDVLPRLSEAPLADLPGSPSYLLPATVLVVTFLVLLVTYAVALGVLSGARNTMRGGVVIVVLGAVVFELTLLALPGLFSQDVFSYIAYGRAAALYGLNPYIWPPSVLQDPVLPWVADIWRTYTSPYGPLWVNLQWLLATVTQGLSITDQALVYRALGAALLLLNLALAWPLLGRVTPHSPAQRTAALAALAWNPVLLLEVAGGAHNDVLMVTFCLLGLLLFRESSRGLTSVAALSLGTVVKYLSGIGLMWLAVASAARGRAWPHRIGRLVLLAGVAVGLAALSFAPWLELPDSLDSLLNETARVGYVNSLPDTLVQLLLGSVGTSGALEGVRLVERVFVIAVFGVYLVWETRQVWSDPGRAAVARAVARGSLVFVVLVSTSVQTWYFCLPVSIAILLGLREPVARLALAYGALALPALYLSYYLREQTPGWVFVVYAFAPLLVLMPELRAWRSRARGGVPGAVVAQPLGLPRTSPIQGRYATIVSGSSIRRTSARTSHEPREGALE
jgi:hypothetical protein